MSLKPVFVFYISGHGFGHASRDLETINALQARQTGLEIIVCSLVPGWLIRGSVTHPVAIRRVECDTGLVQVDSLHADEGATIDRAAAFYADFDAKISAEVDFLRSSRARVVLGDIPPLAFAAAAAAGVHSVALGNFTWDWIYEDYWEHVSKYPDLVPTIRRAYREAPLVLRLPMHGGFAGLEHAIHDIPLIARRSQETPTMIRRALDLPEGPLLLLSFGGYGIRHVDPALSARLSRYTLLITDDESGRDLWAATEAENIARISSARLRQAGCRYTDLVRAVDVVVTKPGYGIVSECIANETAMLYTSRGRFREYEILVAAMQRYTRCEFIDNESLLAGSWEPQIQRLLAAPPPAERPRVDGATVAAEIILEVVEK